MPTLKAVLETASGLYRDQNSGVARRRDELLARVDPGDLESAVRLQRVERGVYILHVTGTVDRTYQLFSRRHSPRPAEH